MGRRKERSSIAKNQQGRITNDPVAHELVALQPHTPPMFWGDLGTDADDWMLKFERSLYLTRMHHDDALAANFLRTFLRGSAHSWYHAQPTSIRASFALLKQAYYLRFDYSQYYRKSKAARLSLFEQHLSPRLSIADVDPKSCLYYDWLDRLQGLAAQIDGSEVHASVLADKAWNALPDLLQDELEDADDSVEDLVIACKDVTKERYDQIMKRDGKEAAMQAKIDELDQKMKRFERLEREMRQGANGNAGGQRSRFTQMD